VSEAQVVHAGAAPAGARLRSQVRREVAAVLTNGEQLLLTLVLPLLALVGLSRTSWLPVDVPAGLGRVDVVAPGVLAVAVLSTAFTSQAIAVAFDRRYGVLRLLGTTPLGRGGLLGARAGAVVVVIAVQAVVLGGTALLLGWRPALGGVPAALLVLLLGATALTALGLLLGGTVRAEGVLAVANLVWVLLVAGGGVLLPASAAGPLEPVVALLPSGALGEGLRTALGGDGFPARDVLVLAVWCVVSVLAARRWFRWD
jgi:ABC-2 type transport system permease protein